MKVIFLDVDGVLNNTEAQERACRVHCNTWAWDKQCLDNLQRIVSDTDAVIVLSSSWRGDPFKEGSPEFMLRAVLAMWDLFIHDVTPDVFAPTDVFGVKVNRRAPRWMEIEQWLGTNRLLQGVESFVILDDRADAAGEVFIDNFIHTKERLGLTFNDAMRAIAVLKDNTTPVRKLV